MKVFVSWSGEPSEKVARLLRSWIPSVIQEVDVYVSSQDIEKGVRWAIDLSETLSEMHFGLIVLTKQNLSAPWILFEAGALSKSVKSRVIPILCDLDRLDVAGSPLGLFQFVTSFTQDELRSAMAAINSQCDKPLDSDRLKEAFEKWWPELFEGFNQIEFATPETEAPLAEGDVSQRLDRIEKALNAVLKSTPPTPQRWSDASVFYTDKQGRPLDRHRNALSSLSRFRMDTGDALGKGLLDEAAEAAVLGREVNGDEG